MPKATELPAQSVTRIESCSRRRATGECLRLVTPISFLRFRVSSFFARGDGWIVEVPSVRGSRVRFPSRRLVLQRRCHARRSVQDLQSLDLRGGDHWRKENQGVASTVRRHRTRWRRRCTSESAARCGPAGPARRSRAASRQSRSVCRKRAVRVARCPAAVRVPAAGLARAGAVARRGRAAGRVRLPGVRRRALRAGAHVPLRAVRAALRARAVRASRPDRVAPASRRARGRAHARNGRVRAARASRRARAAETRGGRPFPVSSGEIHRIGWPLFLLQRLAQLPGGPQSPGQHSGFTRMSGTWIARSATQGSVEDSNRSRQQRPTSSGPAPSGAVVPSCPRGACGEHFLHL